MRLFKGKEDLKRLRERIGFSNKNRPNSKIYWVHSVSVGESNSAFTLIEELLQQNPDLRILFTSTTVTSASQIKKKISQNSRIIHQYLPIDDYFSVKRFVKYWKFEKAIFVESEIWPNLITQSAKIGAKLYLINARMSEKSANRWELFHKTGFNILKYFDISYAQSELDKNRLIKLGLKNTRFIGNLKFCSKKLVFNEKHLKTIKNQVKNRKYWLAASTHKGEEELILNIHQKLQDFHPDILTIIAVRHPHRLNDVLKLIPKGIKHAVRSKEELIQKDTSLYIVDTLGEMGLFYKFSDVSLICGSLIDNIGGHNPFEALKLDSTVISGEFVANFTEIYDNLEKNDACIVIKNQAELLKSLLKLIESSEERKKLLDSWQVLDNDMNNIVQKIAKIIN